MPSVFLSNDINPVLRNSKKEMYDGGDPSVQRELVKKPGILPEYRL
jgi:hypothetical protein